MYGRIFIGLASLLAPLIASSLMTPAYAFVEPAAAPRSQHLGAVSRRLSRPRSARTGAPTRYAFTFADADIAAVANQILGVTLKEDYAVDTTAAGKLSFHVDGNLTRTELLAAFEEALALNDIAMVRVAGRYVLMQRAKAKKVAPLQSVMSARVAVGPGFQMLSVPIAFATASEVGKSVEATTSEGVVVEADDERGRLIIAGASGELRNALQAIRSFDRSALQSGLVRTVDVRAASPASLATDLTALLHASGDNGVTVVPMSRLGQIVITARSPAQLAEAMTWVARLDTASTEEASSLWVYHAQNISAAALADSISRLLNIDGDAGAEAASSPGEPAANAGAMPLAAATTAAAIPAPDVAHSLGAQAHTGSSGVRVSVEKESNALLVMAPKSRWLEIKALLDQIDAPPGQVLIEITVLEVTLGHDLSTGVDWSILGAGGRLNIVSSQSPTGAVAPTFPGFAVSFFDNNVKAVIDALASRNNVTVISAPKLIARDNHPALLEVGDQVPITVQSAQSTVTTSAPIVANTEYKDTGIILKITPQINGPDSVSLDFSQEVSSVAQTTTSTINSPTIQQRRFESEMTVHDGETVAIGGLISTTRSNNDNGVPWVKDLPVVGLLFKGQNHSLTKTEIIVLLSAHILRTREDAAAALQSLRNQTPDITSEHLDATPRH